MPNILVDDFAEKFLNFTRAAVTDTAEHIRRNWHATQAFFQGLQYAWVPLISVIMGFLLFALTPQAQDLFLEVHNNIWSAVPFWTFFYAAVIFVWVLPVYVSARWILCRFKNDPKFMENDNAKAEWVCQSVPRVLAAGCLIAILFGQLMALSNAPTLESDNWLQASPNIGINSPADYKKCVGAPWQHITCAAPLFHAQALRALSELSKDAGSENIVFVLYLVFLGLAGAFYLLIWVNSNSWQDKSLLGAFTTYLFYFCIFYFIALMSFVLLASITLSAIIALITLLYLTFAAPCIFVWHFLLLGLKRIKYNWLRLIGKVLWWFITSSILSILASALLIAIYGFAYNELSKPLGLGHLSVLPIITTMLVFAIWWLLNLKQNSSASRLGKFLSRQIENIKDYNSGTKVSAMQVLNAIFYITLGSTLVLLTFQIIPHPVNVSAYIHRALMIPFILGLLVPGITYISHFSFSIRAPVLMAGIAAIAIVTAILPDIYDVRTLPKVGTRPTLEQTVQYWADVNGCELNANKPDQSASEKCPQPIILAAAGGASRAAFLVGGITGALLDGDKTQSADDHSSARRHPFEKQLFAISGVSGGAFGASVLYSALADSQLEQQATNGLGKPPCKRGINDKEYFAPEKDFRNSWRYCLELILAGDFLSPVFVGLLGNDVFGAQIRHDRAAILENAWERRYAGLTGQRTLERPLIALRNDVLGASPGNWLPMLMLNGTSVTTGRRIIVSDIDTIYSEFSRTGDIPRRRLFRDAYDLHELLGGQPQAFDVAIASPNGLMVLTQSSNGNADTLQLWDARTGKSLWVINSITPRNLSNLKFVENNSRIIAASEDGYMLVDVKTGKIIKNFIYKKVFNKSELNDIEDYEEISFRLRPGSTELLLYTAQGFMLIDTISDQKIVKHPLMDDENNYRVIDAAFSLDGTSLITLQNIATDDDKSTYHIAVMDAQTLDIKYVAEFAPKDNNIYLSRVAISNDGRTAALTANYADSFLAFVDMQTGKIENIAEHQVYKEHEFAETLAFDPSQKKLVVTTLTGSYFYDVSEKQFIESFEPLELFSGAPNLITSSILKGHAQVRQIDQDGHLQLLRSFKGSEGFVRKATLFSKGKRLLTVDDNGAARIWDTQTGHELKILRNSVTSSDCQNCDIALSTSASSSARFPIISPHGNIRSSQEDRLVDRIVDGGYYENFGAITALELVDILRSRYKLRPAVILINNEPSQSSMNCIMEDSRIAYPKAPRSVAFSTLRSPLAAALGTRSARGTHAAVELCSKIGPENFAFLTVQPDRIDNRKPLSMSWWLSKHVQSYLDAQIDSTGDKSNDAAFRKIDKWRRVNPPE